MITEIQRPTSVPPIHHIASWQSRVFDTAEGLIAMILLWQGVWFLVPMWHTFASNPAYMRMANIASEDIWGAWQVLVSGGMLLSMITNHRQLFPAFLGLAFITALSICVSMALVNIAIVAIPAFGVVAVYAAWRLRRKPHAPTP